MRIKRFTSLCTALLFASATARADSLVQLKQLAGDCPIVEAQSAPGVFAWPHLFGNGRRDLVMANEAQLQAGDYKRVSFGAGKAAGCDFFAVALAKGGDWGWHLAWATPQGVYYARMDGEAWVSSPARRLAKIAAKSLKFEAQGQQLMLIWGASGEHAVSADEGRNWD